MRVDTSGIFNAFQNTLALVEGDERERMERVLRASREAVQGAVLELLQAAAEEVNAAAEGTVRADLAYSGDGVEFNVSTTNAAAADAAIEFEFDTGEIERLTLRLPSELKELAAFAADQHGVSLNTWLTRLVSREAARRSESGDGRRRGGPRSRGAGQSLKGWIGG